MTKTTLLLILCSFSLQAQYTPADTISIPAKNKFKYQGLIIPAVLIGYGIIGMESEQLIDFNTQISTEVGEHIDEKITLDDFSQYAPMAAVFGLHAMGVKSKHGWRDQFVIASTAYLLMSGSVTGLKSITQMERPDGSSRNSFPSGHTATAFAGAEMLWQEYKEVSIWYGISGYVVASGTGLFRMYNNRHWLTDVAAGAGIGILSTKAAYLLQPCVSRLINGKQSTKFSASAAPFYNGKQMGLGMAVGF